MGDAEARRTVRARPPSSSLLAAHSRPLLGLLALPHSRGAVSESLVQGMLAEVDDGADINCRDWVRAGTHLCCTVHPLPVPPRGGSRKRLRALTALFFPTLPPPQAGRTPLHIVAKQGRLDLARLLIELGADVKAKCKARSPREQRLMPATARTRRRCPAARAACGVCGPPARALASQGQPQQHRPRPAPCRAHAAFPSGHPTRVRPSCPQGLPVVRGAAWDKDVDGDSDGGAGSIGFAVAQGNGWCEVTWASGGTYLYRISPKPGKYTLACSESDTKEPATEKLLPMVREGACGVGKARKGA